MADFQKGDVVYLNSNPEKKFTVHNILSDYKGKRIEVVYFNEKNNQFEYPKFPPELLTRYSKAE